MFANNKGADQQTRKPRLISAFVISIFKLVSVAEETGYRKPWRQVFSCWGPYENQKQKTCFMLKNWSRAMFGRISWDLFISNITKRTV